MIAMCLIDSQEISNRKKKHKKRCFFAQMHSLKLGLEKFGKKGKDGARKEAKQLNDRTVWKPAHQNDMTIDEKKKMMKSLIFLSEKRDGTVKGRMCDNVTKVAQSLYASV